MACSNFPTAHSGPYEIEVGQYRTGEMQVISCASCLPDRQVGKEKVHYQAVNPKLVKAEMDKFLDWLKNAMIASENATQKILGKAEFWKLHDHTPINERKRLMLNKLFDGFEGKLQTSKWAKITKTSTDTALRDIKDLIGKGILQQTEGGGRNANYELTENKAKPKNAPSLDYKSIGQQKSV